MTGQTRLPFAVSQRQGFRLHKFEVWNWGTFDQRVFSVRPAGKSTLLIGQNGSGKSTLVDALLTLLVRPGVRNFNVAAGARKRERDEKSYLLGAYDRGSADDGSDIRVKHLRPKGEGYSALLACFGNEDLHKTFTVAQILYLGTDQGVEKVYCFSEGERSIEGDLGQLESTDGLLKALRGRGFRATRTFQEFEGWFQKATRVKPKAMEVFNQTVAVKDIQRLNDFIRDHMLEPYDWGEKVERLLGHFTQLSEAHDSLVRVREQRDLLEPVARIGAEYRQQAEALERAERLLAASAAFFAQRTVDLMVPRVESQTRELAATIARKEELDGALRGVRERIRLLRNELESAGGDRLKDIPRLIEIEQAYRFRKQQNHERFLEALAQLDWQEPLADEAGFLGLQRQLPALETEFSADVTRQNAEYDAVTVEWGSVRQLLTVLREELAGLQQRKENIPEWCVQLRQSICHDLGLASRDLPFAAELMQVGNTARDWEASIEKVLRGLALSLLVPDRFLTIVAAYVERTGLRAQGRGQRLVYLRVSQKEDPFRSAVPRPNSLTSKLAFREGHSFLPWLKAELVERFDYACCETIEEFESCPGLAMTRQRHLKTGRQRHEKDDREQVLDPRNFVLGWDNREKKQRLVAEIEKLVASEAARAAQRARIDERKSWLRQRLAALAELRRVTSYSELDHAAHARAIEQLEEERRAIEEQSDSVRTIRRQLTQAEVEENALDRRHEQLVGDERQLQHEIDQARQLIVNAEEQLRRHDAAGSLAAHRHSFGELDAELTDPPLSVATLFEHRTQFASRQATRIRQLNELIEPVRNRLTDAMSRFLRTCPEEQAELRASVDYLASFLGLRQRILADDLPRHEQRFKERLNQKVIEEIGLFRGALEQERRKIEDKIELLNDSLRKLEYRPGTHIQLEPRPIRDADIAEFQGRLRDCVEGSFEDSAEANEARFRRIKDLIVRLRDDESRRWRDKVTDVRRWFDFVAAVNDRETRKTVSVYQDSSGQSGGEKAKLAFTILVAAIAYQYDLDPEHPVSDRFHFVMVDEMFSKVDDQHAEYALNLFRQFGLQLLIVAPLDAKARVTQPFVGCYLHVVKKGNCSAVFEMTAEEFEQSADQPPQLQPSRQT